MSLTEGAGCRKVFSLRAAAEPRGTCRRLTTGTAAYRACAVAATWSLSATASSIVGRFPAPIVGRFPALMVASKVMRTAIWTILIGEVLLDDGYD